MELKYDYQTLDINGLPVAEVISALQAWEAENPEATNAAFYIYSDTEYSSLGKSTSLFAEIGFHRPYIEEEIEDIKTAKQKAAEWQERRERELYELLKEKFENGN